MSLNALKRCRIDAGLSVPEVAERLKVSIQMIYMYESGDRHPNVKRLKQLSGLYGKTIDELLEEGTK